MIYILTGVSLALGILLWLQRAAWRSLVKEKALIKQALSKADELITGQAEAIENRNKLIGGLQKKVVQLGGRPALVDMLNELFSGSEDNEDGMLN